MNKGLLLRYMQKLKDRNLRTKASEILAPKVPKSLFIAAFAYLGYKRVRYNLPKANPEDLLFAAFHNNWGEHHAVYLTKEKAAEDTLHGANWGYARRTNDADALVILEVRPAAARAYAGEWAVQRPEIADVLSAQLIPIYRSEFDMFCIDHDVIEDANETE